MSRFWRSWPTTHGSASGPRGCTWLTCSASPGGSPSTTSATPGGHHARSPPLYDRASQALGRRCRPHRQESRRASDRRRSSATCSEGIHGCGAAPARPRGREGWADGRGDRRGPAQYRAARRRAGQTPLGARAAAAPLRLGRRRGQGRQTPPSSGHRRGAQGLEAIRPKPPEQAHGAIFCGKRGPYTARGIEYVLTELGRRANVPNVHPHRFRHDTGRRLVESVDLPTVAAWLGHERLDTVRIYSQPDKAALERAATCLEAR